MTAAIDTKPSTNGTLKFAMRGFVKVQLGDNEPEIQIDAKAVYDAWFVIDWRLRDKDGNLPNDQWDAHGRDQQEFVQSIFDHAYANLGGDSPKQAPRFSRGDAEAFIVAMREKVGEIRSFFLPKKDELSSVPTNTEGERINFSQ